MPRIQKLDSALISQIAAGEVIERPASALRELLDNAIDAGAGTISARIERGGIGLVSVADDGVGIAKEDLELAFERHATSKIHSFQELTEALSLGFRGEALASIGSVCNARITSRARGSDRAWSLTCEGGALSPIALASRPEGTLIEARDMFFHVPARRKFLRTEALEGNRCREAFLRSALSHPGIEMSFTKDGKLLHHFRAQSARERAAAVLGEPFGSALVSLSRKGELASIEGFFAPASALPGHRECEFLYVNGRYIKDKTLAHAVKEALLAQGLGKDAAYCLWISMAPSEVDANAHPAKTEVRFRDTRGMHQLMFSAMTEALAPQAQSALSARRALLGPPQSWVGPGLDGGALFDHEGASAAGPGPQMMGWSVLPASQGFWVAQTRWLQALELAAAHAQLARAGSASPQELLTPWEIELPAPEAALALKNQLLLASLGLALQESESGAGVRLTHAPEAWMSADFPAALLGIAEALGRSSDAVELCHQVCLRLDPAELKAVEPGALALGALPGREGRFARFFPAQ